MLTPRTNQQVLELCKEEDEDEEEVSPTKAKVNHIAGFVDLERQIPRDPAYEKIYKGTLIGKPPHY